MLTLFPSIKPYVIHQLNVASSHTLYVEESGNPDGVPILMVHGGPGKGSCAEHRRFFDPDFYRIILFDQRGSGQSKPRADIKHNTTQYLIEDMEMIRESLGITRWVLIGGAWGATLSLAYTETHPDKVIGLVLWAVFLSRRQDRDWITKQGANLIFPDQWEAFVQAIDHPADAGEALIQAYYHRLTGTDDLACMAAAKAWTAWWAHCATRQISHGLQCYHDIHAALSLARISCHYFLNQNFLEEAQLLAQISRLKDVPGFIVHGRYDMVCPLDNAWALHKAWPSSELAIVRDAGHYEFEPAYVDMLVRVVRTMAREYC